MCLVTPKATTHVNLFPATTPVTFLIESLLKGGAVEAITTYSDDGASLLKEVTLPDGSNLFYENDAAHRLTAIANRLGERIEYALDAMGNRTAEVLRSDSGTIVRSQSQICDELGRLLQSIGAGSQKIGRAHV